MNNNDLFQIEMNNKRYWSAAKLAIQFAYGKSSKSGAWAWARSAQEAANKFGVTLDPGNLSWPDLEGMEGQLDAAKNREMSL